MLALFCYYNVSNGPQAKLAFSKDFKHCNVILYDGEACTLVSADKSGFYLQQLKITTMRALMRAMKTIESLIALQMVFINKRQDLIWKPCVVRSCNEVSRYATGIDIGFTFNPKHLYNKILRYDGANYELLHAWRR